MRARIPLELNGAETSVVVGRRKKLGALNAVFINSMSSGALSFNDTHFTTVAHPTSPVAAGLGREAAAARIILEDGRKLEASVAHCRGSVGRPMTDADITEKTRGQLLTAYPDAAAERILAQAWRIEECPQVGHFCRELAPVVKGT